MSNRWEKVRCTPVDNKVFQRGDLVAFNSRVSVYSKFVESFGLGGELKVVDCGDLAIVIGVLNSPNEFMYSVACYNGLWFTHIRYIEQA